MGGPVSADAGRRFLPTDVRAMSKNLVNAVVAQVVDDATTASVNVAAVMAEFMRRRFDENAHEMLQYFGLAPDLRWWKP
jgi:hypothetical protein